MLDNQLKHLNPIELLLLQKHIKLGKNHLRDSLSAQETDQLFQLGLIEKEVEEKMAADTPEFMGTVSLVINTIFTATLGAWMGMTGFLEVSLNAPGVFFYLLAFCIVIGAAVGFCNYRFTKRATERAIEKRKIKTVEVEILKTLNQHRRSEIEAKISILMEILKELKVQEARLLELPQDFDDHKVCLDWLNQVEQTVKDFHKNEELSQIFFSEVKQIKLSLQKDLNKDLQKSDGVLRQILHKLTRAPLQPKLPKTSWKERLPRVLVSVIPVAFGGFSSLFVYLGGAPRVARELGHERLFQFLSQPEIKYIELAVAICITLYFACIFLYMNRKAFKREQELAKISVLLNREENQLELLDDKFLKIKQLEDVIKPISRVYQAFKKLES